MLIKSLVHSLPSAGNPLLNINFDSVVLPIYICKHHMDYMWCVHIEVQSIIRPYFIFCPVQILASIITVNGCFILVWVKNWGVVTSSISLISQIQKKKFLLTLIFKIYPDSKTWNYHLTTTNLINDTGKPEYWISSLIFVFKSVPLQSMCSITAKINF